MRLAIATLLILLHIPARVTAQTVTVSGMAVRAETPLTGDWLPGGSVALAFPTRFPRLMPRISVEHARGSSERIGVPCGGLAFPGACPEQPLEDRSQWTGVNAGLGLRLAGGARATVAVTVDAAIVVLRAQTRGLTTGQQLSGSRLKPAGVIGLDASFRPSMRRPLWIEASAGFGHAIRSDSDTVDGYEPFLRDFSFQRHRLGISWRP